MPSIGLEDIIGHIEVLTTFTQQALHDSNQAISLLNCEVSLVRVLIPFMRDPSLGPNHLSKIHSPNPISLGIQFQCMNWGGDINVQFIAVEHHGVHITLKELIVYL